MVQSLRRRGPLIGFVLVAAAFGFGGGRSAEATPGPTAIVGPVPQSGVGLSATGETLTPADAVTALAARGCVARTLAMARAGSLVTYVADAPTFVNTNFPATIEAGQILAYACTAATPSVTTIPTAALAPSSATTGGMTEARSCMPGTAISLMGTGRLARFGMLPSSGVLRGKVLLVDYPDRRGDATKARLVQVAMAETAQILAAESGGRLRVDFEIASSYQRLPASSQTYWKGFAYTDLQVRSFSVDVRPLLPPTDAGFDFVIISDTAGVQFMDVSRFTLDDRTRVVMPVVVVTTSGAGGAKVWAHEILHLLGLPDLYDVSSPFLGLNWMLQWDRMNTQFSAQLSMWHRWELGWLQDERVSCLTGPANTIEVASRRASETAAPQLALVKTSPDTAVAIEVDINRAEEARTGQCTWTLVAYAVDASKKTGTGPLRLLPGAGTTTDQWTARCAEGAVSRPTVTDPASGVTIDVIATTAETMRARITQPDALTASRPWSVRPGTVTLRAGTTAPRLHSQPIDGIEWMRYPVSITSDKYLLNQVAFLASDGQVLRGSWSVAGVPTAPVSRDVADTLTFFIPAKRPSGPITVRVAMPDGGAADYVINHLAR